MSQPSFSAFSRSATTKSNSANDVLLPQVFPDHLPRPHGGLFLRNESPYRDSFEEALRGPYEGFIVDEAEKLDEEDDNEGCRIKETAIQSSLETMLQDGFFRTDITQPFGLGTKCAKTYVTRCVVGNPGTTYKYLGLRMFAHPWTTEATDRSHNGADSSTNIFHANNKRNRKRLKRNNNDNNNPNQRDSDQATIVAHDASMKIKNLSHALTTRTQNHLRDLNEYRRQRSARPTKGRPDFDICLINRMESSSDLKPFVFRGSNSGGSNTNKLSADKSEAKTSVSWHADSSLEHYSTIAVYQTLVGGSNETTTHQNRGDDKDRSKNKKTPKGETTKDDEGKWWVALRVAHHSEGPQASQRRRGTSTEASIVEETPPIAVSLPSGSAYYLLDDFNHHHQHTVLTTGDAASAGVRYSCTFRLLRDSHNVQDWIDRGNAAIRQFHKKGPRIWRSEQLLLTEIESEWIRQLYIQGAGNKELLWEPYWKDAMEDLLSIWSELELRTKQTMDLLRAAAEERCSFNTVCAEEKSSKAERKARDRRKKALRTIQELISRIQTNNSADATGEIAHIEFYQPFAELLEKRAEMRELWGRREKDHVFREIPPNCRPMQVPFLFEQHSDANNNNGSKSKSVGTSPLPEFPAKLRELSRELVQCGRAYREVDVALLPPPWTTDLTKPDPSSKEENRSPEDDHSKPMDWSSWGSVDEVFGLELQDPWAGAVVDGEKSIETRAYALPPSLIGKRIMIIQTSSGQAGVSGLGNDAELSRLEDPGGNSRIIGCCIFSSVKTYTTKRDFRAEENLHLVTPESGYGWKDGVTKSVCGWVVEKYHRYNESCAATDFDSAVRRFRSLFQLRKTNAGAKNTKKRIVDKKNNTNGKKKKRKRY